MTSNIATTEFIEKYSPWSYSKLSSLKDCPLNFHKTYVDRSSKHMRMPKSAKTYTGTMMHTFLEKVLTGDLGFGQYTNFVAGYRAPERAKEWAFMGADNVRSVYDNTFKLVTDLLTPNSKTGKYQVVSEYKINLDKDLNKLAGVAKVFLTAYLDFVAKDRDNILLVDFKSTGTNCSIYEPQLKLYELMLAKCFPKSKRIHCYIGAFDSGNTVHVRTDSTEDILNGFVKEFQDDLHSTVQPYAEGSYAFTPKESWKCDFCQIRNTCPLHKKKL